MLLGVIGKCGKETAMAYQAYGGGWMALCLIHGQRHRSDCESIADLIAKGETLAPREGLEKTINARPESAPEPPR